MILFSFYLEDTQWTGARGVLACNECEARKSVRAEFNLNLTATFIRARALKASGTLALQSAPRFY